VATFRALLLLLIAFSSTVALAQDAGDDDGGAPDASVSGGGGGDGTAVQEDPTGEETEDQTGRVPTVCQDSADCASGFSCSNQRCVWTGVRRAQGAGCLGGVSGFVILGGAFVLRGRRSGRQ
jgi:hypothetical protein